MNPLSKRASKRAWRFYSGEGTDHRGRTLQQILAWDDAVLEDEHDFIQWLFPLMEPSGVNPDAPVLSPDEIQQFRASADFQARVVGAFRRMLRFYGLQMTEIGRAIRIEKAPNFSTRRKNWITPRNHNFLRVTRILKSLSLLGLPLYAAALLACLTELFAEDGHIIGPVTFNYWQHAVA